MANGNNRVGVREFLKSQGFRDEDIGWNNQSKTVTLQGRDFLKPPTIENNRAFADRTALQNALKQFRQSQTNQTTQTTQTPTYQDRINTFIEQLSQRTQAQPQPFSYDPQSDPAYQAALERARQNIQREQANTNAFLRARGQGRSSYSETVANQIAANAMSQLENEIVPALVQQAYQRYRDQIGDQQTQFGNIMNLVGTLSGLRQQDLDQAQREWQNRFAYGQAIGVFPSGQKTLQMQQFEYQQARDAIADERYKREFDEDVRRWGLEFALNKAIREGQLNVARMNAATSRMAENRLAQQAALNNLYRQWEMTGVAPAGIPGVAPGTPLASEASNIDIAAERDGLINALRSGTLTPEQALLQIREDVQLGIYTPGVAQQLEQVVQTYTQNRPQPAAELTQEQRAAIPSDREIEAEARRLGYPVLDYLSYYKSPNGYSAGIDFNTWRSLYGPRLSAPR